MTHLSRTVIPIPMMLANSIRIVAAKSGHRQTPRTSIQKIPIITDVKNVPQKMDLRKYAVIRFGNKIVNPQGHTYTYPNNNVELSTATLRT